EEPLVTNDIDFEVRGSRGGWRNPAGLPFRGTLQRFQYRLDDGKLFRDYWPVMDHPLQEEPRREQILTEVRKLEIWYYDSKHERFDQWPPPQLEALGERRPRAIQFVLELEDLGEIERWVEVAQ
ncbi:MAG: type II secretion system minor pseudopilin GspJ, partial [Gammaproteobacteria bacterium]